MKVLIKLKHIKLQLGEEYFVQFSEYFKPKKCKLIKVTKEGFNLLNEMTNKCILNKHLYLNKYNLFTIPSNWFIFKDYRRK